MKLVDLHPRQIERMGHVGCVPALVSDHSRFTEKPAIGDANDKIGVVAIPECTLFIHKRVAYKKVKVDCS